MSTINFDGFAPISLLHQTTSNNPDSILFKIPASANGVWEDITYTQFLTDVERVAYHTLCQRPQWPIDSVIGIWTFGNTYLDVVHIFAIMRAGCVPHLINVELSKALDPVVSDLFNESNACALFIDPSLIENNFSKTKYSKIFTIKDIRDYPIEFNRDLLPPIPINFPSDRLVLVLQTSGSTSGKCKLVHQDSRTISAQVKKRKYFMDKSRRDRPLIAPRIGSFCHTAQIIEFLTIITYAGTVILVNPNFNSSKLIQMYQECQLTMISRFSAFVALHLKESRTDPLLLNVLKSMDEIFFCGSTIPESELQWAKENEISVLNGFGMTECGVLLIGLRDDPAYLIPQALCMEGLHYDFRPISSTTKDMEISLNRNSKIQNLEELIVLSNSIDCPHPTLRSKVDGHFYTGDIFEEVYKGRYLFRGRIDDLIKMENARICDTKSIEDRLRKNCDDIMHACVVVGTNRPSPALLIEPKLSTYNTERLIASIELQLTAYNANVYEHERLTRDHIIVVQKGSLPRTLKGNIRRSVTEQMFSQQLDQIYRVL